MIVVKLRRNSGFSLVELVTVILLLGILGVFALSRLDNQDAFAARGFFDDTVAAVRFAHKLALSSGCDVRVILSSTGYQLRQSTDCADDDFVNPVDNPANRANNYENTNAPAGFTLTPGVITFNARGENENGLAVYTFSKGSISFSFRVHAGSGLVEVL